MVRNLATVILLGVLSAVPNFSFAQFTFCCDVCYPGNFIQESDENLTMCDPTSVIAKKKYLMDLIWGKSGIPLNHNFVKVSLADAKNYVNMSGINEDSLRKDSLDRVEVLTFDFETKIVCDNCQTNCSTVVSSNDSRVRYLPGKPGNPLRSVVYHFIGKAKSNEVVILHQGHTRTLKEVGFEDFINVMVGRKVDVMVVFMPQASPIDPTDDNCHSCIVDAILPNSQKGSAIQMFFEPTAKALSYLEKAGYTKKHMAGLSGGGWTTSVYSALDDRISVSMSVASGFIPSYITEISPGDLEQCFFNRHASVQEFYLLGSLGSNKDHLEIFVEYDHGGGTGKPAFYGWHSYSGNRFNNPYKPTGIEAYEKVIIDIQSRISGCLKGIGKGGTFNILVDKTYPIHVPAPGQCREHSITPFAIDTFISRIRQNR